MSMRGDPDEWLAEALAKLASSQEDVASQLPRVLRKLDRISKAVDGVVDVVGHAEGRPEMERASTTTPRGPRSEHAMSPGPLDLMRAETPGPRESEYRTSPSTPTYSSERDIGHRLSLDTARTRSIRIRDLDSCSGVSPRLTAASTKSNRRGMTEQLPDSWPRSLEPRSEWSRCRPSADTGLFLRRSRTSTLQIRDPTCSFDTRAMGDTPYAKDNVHDGDAVRSRGRFVIDPTTRVHMLYNFVCMGFIVYDLIVLPYYVAWQGDLSQRAFVFAMFTAVWWAIDLCLNFTTAFHLNGNLVWNRAAIRAHYVKTWFVPDLALVVIDTASMVIILLAASGSTPVSSVHPFYVARLARMARILRVASAFRILKSAKVVKDHLERNALSESWQLYTKVASCFAIVLVVAHWAACGWYAVGELPSDTGGSWTEQVRDHEPLYQYSTAFHFAVAELTAGGTEIKCRSSAERLYSCVLLMLGLLFGSSLVSGLSASMVQAQMDQKERRVKLVTLQQFMRYHKVEPAMTIRVEKQAIARMRASRRVQYESVTILKDLSASLVSELRFHVCWPHISSHGLFRMMASLHQDMSERICAQAVRFQGLKCQDDLFVAGNEAASSYTVLDGTLSYTPSCWVKEEEHVDVVEVGGGSWLAEAALWSQWIHVGNATAVTECTVLALPVDEMIVVVRRDPMLQGIMSEYCKEFHGRLTNMEFSDTRPTDLCVSRTSFEEVVTSLDVESQRAVYQATINQTFQEQAGMWQHKAKLPELQRVVEEGKSAVLLNAEGHPYRVVRMSVGRIALDDGRVLVELGRVERSAPATGSSSGGFGVGKFKLGNKPGKATSHITSTCRLPSLTSEFSESPHATWERMLVGGLEGLAGSIELRTKSHEKEWVDSPELGVRTLHQKTIFHARVADENTHFGEVFLPSGDAAAGSGGTANRPRRPNTHSIDIRIDSHESGRQGSMSSPVQGLAVPAAGLGAPAAGRNSLPVSHATRFWHSRPSWSWRFPRLDRDDAPQATSGAALRHSSYWDDILADPFCEREFQKSIIVVTEASGKEVLYRWTLPVDLEELTDRQDRHTRTALHKFLSRFEKDRFSRKLVSLGVRSPTSSNWASEASSFST